MRKWVLAILASVLVASAANSWADGSPAAPEQDGPISASVGGGIPNPWRLPYRTAVAAPWVPADPANHP